MLDTNIDWCSTHAVEDEEDVVERDGADEVEEEPRADVVARDQPRVDDHLLAVVLLHYPWKEEGGQSMFNQLKSNHMQSHAGKTSFSVELIFT